MGLQIRLAHSLGERLIDLDERGIDRPVVVGRSSSAEVEIPSAAVARRHCILFVHDGRWAIQDAGSPSGTYLNGNPVRAPAPVGPGDVITIGPDPGAPSITIDPFGIHAGEQEEQPEDSFSPGATGSAARSSALEAPPAQAGPVPAVQPTVSGARYWVPRSPAAGPVAYAPPTAGHRVPQYGAPTYLPPSPQGAGQDELSGGEWADVPRASSYYVPKPRRVSPAVMAWTVLFCLVVLAGAIWTVRNVQRKQRQQRPVVVIRGDEPATGRAPPPARATTSQPATQMAAAAQPDMTEPQPQAPDPRREDESWQAVERARFNEPVIAIVRFNDYLELNPDTPFRKDVEQYVDEALDRLWWARVVDLFGEIDVAKREIDRRREEIKLSREEQFKKNLEQEIRQWSEKRETADRRLRTEMKFTGAEPPNLHDSQRLAHFRSERPDAYYQKWKAEAYELIRRSRGQRLPWKETR